MSPTNRPGTATGAAVGFIPSPGAYTVLHLETTEEDRRRWNVTNSATTHHPTAAEMLRYARERWQYISRTPGVVSRCTVRDDGGNVVARWEWRRS